MQVEQTNWHKDHQWGKNVLKLQNTAQVALVFGDRHVLDSIDRFNEIRSMYPNARILGCSTAGEISGTTVSDHSIVVTALNFAATEVQVSQVEVGACGDGSLCGERLAAALPADNLVHVFAVSDGTSVNGSELVRGMLRVLPRGVTVTGGLAGDGDRFEQTLVICDQAPKAGIAAALGLYGRQLKIGYGSLGGWDSFGPHRLVTRSRSNVLFELDNQPALALYKKYLGEHASGLPATGLLFPLSVKIQGADREVVRTILGVDETNQSLTFAGDIPEGSFARLMKANMDRLVDGAQGAATTSYEALGAQAPELAILISCIGRRLVLKQRTEEELDSVQAVLGAGTVMTGFYSYGEICPAAPNANCELHNQTMTITTFTER